MSNPDKIVLSNKETGHSSLYLATPWTLKDKFLFGFLRLQNPKYIQNNFPALEQTMETFWKGKEKGIYLAFRNPCFDPGGKINQSYFNSAIKDLVKNFLTWAIRPEQGCDYGFAWIMDNDSLAEQAKKQKTDPNYINQEHPNPAPMIWMQLAPKGSVNTRCPYVIFTMNIVNIGNGFAALYPAFTANMQKNDLPGVFFYEGKAMFKQTDAFHMFMLNYDIKKDGLDSLFENFLCYETTQYYDKNRNKLQQTIETRYPNLMKWKSGQPNSTLASLILLNTSKGYQFSFQMTGNAIFLWPSDQNIYPPFDVLPSDDSNHNVIGLKYFFKNKSNTVEFSYPVFTPNVKNSDGGVPISSASEEFTLGNKYLDNLSPNLVPFDYGISPCNLLNYEPIPPVTIETIKGLIKKNYGNSKIGISGSFHYPFLRSYLRTVLGAKINLVSTGGLSFSERKNEGKIEQKESNFTYLPTGQTPASDTPWYLVPSGQFMITMDKKHKDHLDKNGQIQIIVGLSGTETISVTPLLTDQPPSVTSDKLLGDRIVFHPGYPALAPDYPLSGKHTAANTELLSDDYLTSWVSFEKGDPGNPDILYHAQPEKAPLFGFDDQLIKAPGFLGFQQSTSANLSTDAVHPMANVRGIKSTKVVFPMVPYGELVLPPYKEDAATKKLDLAARKQKYQEATQTELVQFETQILAPWRKHQIARQSGQLDQKKPVALTHVDSIPTTTPEGFLVTLDKATKSRWKSMKIAQTSNDSLSWSSVSHNLQSALQTNHLFMVASYNDNSQFATTGQFDNQINLDGWPFKFDIPSKSPNGAYRNVFLFKYRTDQALFDGSDVNKQKGLVCDTRYWAMASQFNATPGGGLFSLSQWLKDYMQRAWDKWEKDKDVDYAHFHKIISDPNWQGTLILKVDISVESFPSELKGLLAGIDPSRFYAHHFGINMSTVKSASKKLEMQPQSSLFALIDYEDTTFENLGASVDNYRKNAPIGSQSDYYFKVLQLKIRFDNGKITSFGSYIALTINQLFKEKARSDNRERLLILKGSYERHNGQPAYTFNTNTDSMVYLNSAAFVNVEITKATFSTLQSKSQATQIRTRFSFWGYHNFRPLTQKLAGGKGNAGFDLLSMGNEFSELQAVNTAKPNSYTVKSGKNGKGMAFSNLYIDMDFNLGKIGNQFQVTQKTFDFKIEDMAFDKSASFNRKASLLKHFPLQVINLFGDNGESDLTKKGFLPVEVQGIKAQKLQAGSWYGIAFKLNAGTLGQLASEAGFNTELLIAWNTGGSAASWEEQPIVVGLKLPGANPQAPSFSLQGILNLGFGSLSLESNSGSSYLLKIRKIAFKFLGISVPPGDHTDFILFGDPKPNSTPKSLGWYAAYQS